MRMIGIIFFLAICASNRQYVFGSTKPIPWEGFMAEIAGIEIAAVEGFDKSSDGSHALVGLVTSDGQKIALAVNEQSLHAIIHGFMGALGAFARPKMQSGGRLITLTDWFEVAKIPDQDIVALTFRLGNGGAMTFGFNSTMTERIQETLSSLLGHAHTDLPPEISRQ
jgi:hypothetical protein